MTWFRYVPMTILLVAFSFEATSCGAGLGGPSDTRSRDLADEGATGSHTTPNQEDDTSAGPSVVATLHIMSQCPHCAAAIDALIPLARGLSGRFRLDVDYIGEVVDGQVTSSLGEDELLGDMIELCTHQHATYGQWLGTLECLHQDQRWQQLPVGWEECAQRTGVDTDVVSGCVEGGEGAELLAASFTRSEAAGIDAGPTLVVGEIVVVGRRHRNVFGQVVCSQLDEPAPSLCALFDPLPYVPVTFITDERCRETRCDVTELAKALRAVIWGAAIQHLSYQSEPGAAMYRSASLKHLPAVIIGAELEDDREAFEHLGHLRKSGDYYVKTIGRFDPGKGRWVPAPEIEATVLVDQRCELDECSTDRFEGALEIMAESLKLRRVDYGESDGLALFKKLRPAFEDEPLTLPAVIFSSAVTEEEELYGQLARALVPSGADFVLLLGRWDPTAELCENGVDDDADRRIDCRDPDCAETRVCRPLKRRRLELFTMSQCPFGAQVVEALPTVVEHFGRQRSKLELKIHYVGSISEEGALEAMHGPSEVEENLRQVCVQHHYQKGYAFVDYLACRARSLTSDDWEPCVTAPLEIAKIKRCVEGQQGQRLLRKSYEHAEALGIGGSPSWFVNNRYEMEGRSARTIVGGFCERNPGPECDVVVEEAAEHAPQGGGCESP